MSRVNREKFRVYEGVFDEYTLQTLETLKRKKYFDSLGNCIKVGKEAGAYLASKDDGTKLAIKIYRMTAANFKKISSYIQRDYRFQGIKGNNRRVILAWCQKEYRNLLIAHKAGVLTPRPVKQLNNCVIMDYIEGDMLKNTEIENPKELFEILLEQITLLTHNARLIHADLSEFNILIQDQIPYIIDMGQAISIKDETDFKEKYDFFERDIINIVEYFNKKFKLGIEAEKIIAKLTKDLF